MQRIKTVSLAGLGLLAICSTWVGALGQASTPNDDGPVIVVAAPWGPSAEKIASLAGASVVGPVRAPLSVLAAGARPETYHAAGAIAVLSPKSLPFFCDEESPE